MTTPMIRAALAPRHLLMAALGGLTVATFFGALQLGLLAPLLVVVYVVDLLRALVGRPSRWARIRRIWRLPAVVAAGLLVAVAMNPWAPVAEGLLVEAKALRADPALTTRQVEAFLADLDQGGIQLIAREDFPSSKIDARVLVAVQAWAAEVNATEILAEGLDVHGTLPSRLAQGPTTMLTLMNTAEISRQQILGQDEPRFLILNCVGSREEGFALGALPDAMIFGQDAGVIAEMGPLEAACETALDMPITDPITLG